MKNNLSDNERQIISNCWIDIKKDNEQYQEVIYEIMRKLNNGDLRVSYKINQSLNEVNKNDIYVDSDIKKAILLFFKISNISVVGFDNFYYKDRIPLKNNILPSIRVVPGSIIRFSSYIADNCIIMPSFINIGVYIGSNTLIDSFATIGSCAQIGENVHIGANVTIGGVLEPINSRPVFIGNNVFIGAQSAITEGIHIGDGAKIGAGSIITENTPIFDKESQKQIGVGDIPGNTICVPSTYNDGSLFNKKCMLVVKYLKDGDYDKLKLNKLLRN